MNKTEDDGIKEVFWPPNGYSFKEVALNPVFCKPKLIPLKSVTLERLERMQSDALEKLREMEEKQKQVKEEAETQDQCLDNTDPISHTSSADIWRADESTPR